MTLHFELLNVFAIPGQTFSGNPLAVVTGGAGLDDGTMLALARQFNLSETTFITDAGSGPRDASVRIFTPDYEMPFAGHPTLGTAHVVAGLHGDARAVTLSMPAGRIPVERVGDVWTLTANAARCRTAEARPAEIASALGIDPESLVAEACVWVDSGVEQLIVELRDVDALRRATPDVPALARHACPPGGHPHLYAWARTGSDTLEARLFFVQGGAAVEDPATGSACANLGGWLAALGERGSRYAVSQGDAVGRPSRLDLAIDDAGTVRVGGLVHRLGRGELILEP